MIRPHRISNPIQWALALSALLIVLLAAIHVGVILLDWAFDQFDSGD